MRLAPTSSAIVARIGDIDEVIGGYRAPLDGHAVAALFLSYTPLKPALQNRLRGLQALGASDAIATEPLGTCASVFAPARDVAVRSRIDTAAAP